MVAAPAAVGTANSDAAKATVTRDASERAAERPGCLVP
ncbi:MAG: hypothetical protein AVDCRST_MAG69-1986 [uncultured Solirubrobacteraceae bacterium]|uniref:Uncharacterized protein n=1 Tax=uncultured Solirubrobacteraceae bacterium TaxID=1162706 RepID=A0A6J4SLB7_9ACTN|nr:MAG: hypothetical protein AVDCRST_MAG69-1986 [uncultured Solirubrobacteraceae bacterium]